MATKQMHGATPTTVEAERTSPLTTTKAAPERVIDSRVPGRRVLRIINPFVSAILRSPLHGVLSGRLLLLTFTGRKSSKRYTIPVGYTPEGDKLILFSSYSWYKNLRGGGPVVVHLRGVGRAGRAEPIEEREAVLEVAEHLVAEYGLEEAGARIGLALDIDPPPSRKDLARHLRATWRSASSPTKERAWIPSDKQRAGAN